jgi:hypothetical protein
VPALYVKRFSLFSFFFLIPALLLLVAGSETSASRRRVKDLPDAFLWSRKKEREKMRLKHELRCSEEFSLA